MWHLLQENSRAAEGMMDETLVYSRKNKITVGYLFLTLQLIIVCFECTTGRIFMIEVLVSKKI